tara:strand:+ start:1861 stop:2814 length:954 start_codon:yes stop_codon:yes gene_type:complete
MSDVNGKLEELQLEFDLLSSTQNTTHSILCELVQNESERIAKAVADAMGPFLSRLDSLESENTRLKAKVAALESSAATVSVPVVPVQPAATINVVQANAAATAVESATVVPTVVPDRMMEFVLEQIKDLHDKMGELEKDNKAFRDEVAELKKSAATVSVPVQAVGAPRAPPPPPPPLPGVTPPPPPLPGSPADSVKAAPDSVKAAPDSAEAAPEVVAPGEGGVVVDAFQIQLMQNQINTLVAKVKQLEGRGSTSSSSHQPSETAASSHRMRTDRPGGNLSPDFMRELRSRISPCDAHQCVQDKREGVDASEWGDGNE